MDLMEVDSTFDKGECYGYFQHLSIPVGAKMSQAKHMSYALDDLLHVDMFELCVCVLSVVPLVFPGDAASDVAQVWRLHMLRGRNRKEGWQGWPTESD